MPTYQVYVLCSLGTSLDREPVHISETSLHSRKFPRCSSGEASAIGSTAREPLTEMIQHGLAWGCVIAACIGWRALPLLRKFCREMGMNSEGFIQPLRVGHSATPMWKQKGPHVAGVAVEEAAAGRPCPRARPPAICLPTRSGSFSILPVDRTCACCPCPGLPDCSSCMRRTHTP